MPKSIVDRFVEFKCRHNLSTAKIQEMATEYANSGPDTARSYFVKKYGISEHVFYRARDFAVICMLVDYKTTNRILRKAASNYAEKNPERTMEKSISHSALLRNQRAEYFGSFTQKEIEDILYKYAEGIDLNKIATAYDTGVSAINFLLKKGLLLGYADEAIYAAIRLRIKLLGRDINEIYR